jgi:hypothetical protein
MGPVPRPLLPLVAVAAALMTTGCGADRLTAPDASRPYSTEGPAQREFPQQGISFQAPADWRFDTGEAPLVATTSSGTATIAIWRYPRSEPLPRDDVALDQADGALQQAAKTRDESFRVQQSRRVRVDGARGIQLLGTERVAGRERRVRSTHVYAKGAEYVVDTYAAPRDFDVVDRTIFQPLVRSFKIDPPRS